MKMKHKRWSKMTADELAIATKEFDDPNYNSPAQKPTKSQLEPRKVPDTVSEPIRTGRQVSYNDLNAREFGFPIRTLQAV